MKEQNPEKIELITETENGIIRRSVRSYERIDAGINIVLRCGDGGVGQSHAVLAL